MPLVSGCSPGGACFRRTNIIRRVSPWSTRRSCTASWRDEIRWGLGFGTPENPWKPSDVGFRIAHRTVDEVEIVGVVADVKYLALGDPAEPSIYLTVDQWTNRRQTLVVRMSTDEPASLIPAIRRKSNRWIVF